MSAIEKELLRLLEIVKADETDLDSCMRFVKLFETFHYFDSCGFIETSFHGSDIFEEMREWCLIGKDRLKKARYYL